MPISPFKSSRLVPASAARPRGKWLASAALAALFAVMPLVPAALAQARPSPVGNWELVTGEQRYRVSFCGDGTQICAKLVWLHPSLRTPENVRLLNTYVVQGAVADPNGGWAGTVTLDGKSYTGKVTLVGENAMRVNACSGMLCQAFELRGI
jgi:uncharacterized protein (DUF2147 family)